MPSALNIIIGLAAVYTAFSLLASWLNEGISTFSNLRADTLKDGIKQMVGSAELRDKLYGQPSIVAAQSPSGRDPSYLAANQFSLAVTSMLNTAWLIGQTGQSAFTALSASVSELPDSQLKSTLTSILAQSGADAKAFVSGVEAWFNANMDRITGWYRRNAQLWLLGIGLALALCFNVDSIRLGQSFIGTPLNLDACKLQGAPADAQQCVSRSVFSQLTLGWKDPSYCPKASSVGNKTPLNAIPSCWAWDSVTEWGWWIFDKIVGVLLTAVALSLGAPFWFDTLSNFVNVRGSGPPPQTGTSAKG